MRCGLVVYNGMTALDFIGFYDAVTRLQTMRFMENFTWQICAATSEIVDDRGLAMQVHSCGQSLAQYDLLFVPGGMGSRVLRHDSRFIAWLQSGAATSLKVSVCTGSLLLGAAGFLKDAQATTHPAAFRELEPYCRSVVKARIVDCGHTVTAGGVSSAIDLGLYLVEKLAGATVREKIALQMDYPYYPGEPNTQPGRVAAGTGTRGSARLFHAAM